MIILGTIYIRTHMNSQLMHLIYVLVNETIDSCKQSPQRVMGTVACFLELNDSISILSFIHFVLICINLLFKA